MPMSVAETIQDSIAKIRASISSVLLGKPEAVEGVLVALLAQGHVLIEDVPGVGKTLLAQALAKSLDCSFRRIQFTPDLLPSDIIGSTVYNMQTGEFRFNRGPLFSQIVLADEINRTSPRTQSALLEAMSAGQVSVDGHTYALQKPFLVLATQNPHEFEGTYLLPESQLDRFMICLSIGYPPRDEEKRLLTEHRSGEPIDQLQSVISSEQVLELQEQVRQVRVDEAIADYLLDIVHATREHRALSVGVSTRGSLMLYRAAQALAILRGRDYTVPDDVKEMAIPVLAHRVIGTAFVRGNPRVPASDALREILDTLPVPD